MEEILRTNDPIRLSYAQSLLEEAGLAHFVADANASIMDGSIGAIPRRLMVLAEDVDAARAALQPLRDAERR